MKKDDPQINSVIEQAIQDYIGGMSLTEVSRRYHLHGRILTPILKQRGIHRDKKAAATLYIPRTSELERIKLPVKDICMRYQQGESEKSLAKAYGVSRPVIVRRLEECGVIRRTITDANRLLAVSRTPEQRQAYTKAAHDATRGSTQSVEQRQKIALTRQEKQLGVSPIEQLLQRWLADRGIESLPQKAIGPYNADLVVNDIIVEIFGGGWHGSGRHLRRARERHSYLLQQGYSILIIWVDMRRWPLTPNVIDYIVSLCEQKYSINTHIISGKGEVFSPDSFYYKKAIGILSTT